MNMADSEARPVLGPAGNKTGSLSAKKPASKPMKKIEKSPVEMTVVEGKKALPSSTCNSLSPKTHFVSAPSVPRRREQLLHSNLSPNASCSSDASTDLFHSRASTGRLIRPNSVGSRRKPCASKPRSVVSDGDLDLPSDGSHQRKRCLWVTPNTDPNYAAFHDEEWGVPVHDDKYMISTLLSSLSGCLLKGLPLIKKFRSISSFLDVFISTCRKLFELLVLSGALSELTWLAILSRRHIFREVFMDFDRVAVSKLNEKKLIAHGSVASSLLSELKLRAIIENARQISKVIDEFGSFGQYIWSFVNHKPIVSRFRYPRQVPVKTPKADVISKDLVRRGFRSVGPTVIYSFMQVAGITNDHLTTCFRFQDCITAAKARERNGIEDTPEEKETDSVIETELSIAIDDLSFSSE